MQELVLTLVDNSRERDAMDELDLYSVMIIPRSNY